MLQATDTRDTERREPTAVGSQDIRARMRGHLDGRWVTLRPLVADDFGWLYDLCVTRGAGLTWRLRGALPPFQMFAEHVVKGTEANFVLVSTTTGQPVGFSQFTEVNYRDQTAALSAVLEPDVQRRAWPVEGLALTVGYGFDVLGFRKLYITSPESVTAAYRRLVGGLLHEEGRLREHQRVLDRYEDFVIYALYARDWPAWRTRLGLDARQHPASLRPTPAARRTP